MTRLRLQVLLDTGPTPAEVREIRDLFARQDFDVSVEGHSYGGPPPTSAFMVVVNGPLAALSEAFAQRGAEGREGFRRLASCLLALRAEPARWGRPHGVRLEDSHALLTVALPPTLPPHACDRLLEIDLSVVDRACLPLRVEWDSTLDRWSARFTTAPRRALVRLPDRATATSARVRQLDDDELRRLWELVDLDTGSAITWRRAGVVLWSALGWGPTSLAHRLQMSQQRVEAVIRNFNADAFSALAPDYTGGERTVHTNREQADAERIARCPPSLFGVDRVEWDARSLADFLVAEGVLEDAGFHWIVALLNGANQT